jgi:general secretion pathway protein J
MQISKGQNGFTLLEVLVSISLTAVVLIILLSGIRLTANARQRGDDKLAAMAQRLAELQAVQAQIGSAVPRVVSMDYEQRHLQVLSFRGTPKEVRFLTRFSWSGERNFGLWLASYRVVEESRGQEQLVISEEGTRVDRHFLMAVLGEETPSTHPTPMGEPADRIEFSYLQPSLPGRQALWLAEWKADEQKLLPGGVQVHWWRGNQEQLLTLVIPVVGEAR